MNAKETINHIILSATKKTPENVYWHDDNYIVIRNMNIFMDHYHIYRKSLNTKVVIRCILVYGFNVVSTLNNGGPVWLFHPKINRSCNQEPTVTTMGRRFYTKRPLSCINFTRISENAKIYSGIGSFNQIRKLFMTSNNDFVATISGLNDTAPSVVNNAPPVEADVDNAPPDVEADVDNVPPDVIDVPPDVNDDVDNTPPDVNVPPIIDDVVAAPPVVNDVPPVVEAVVAASPVSRTAPAAPPKKRRIVAVNGPRFTRFPYKQQIIVENAIRRIHKMLDELPSL